MQIFDRIDATNLDRREWHLWLLAFAVILVLASGMALLIYPAIFSTPVVLSGDTMRKSFFGFCLLSVLLLGYLVDRQIEIRQLRRRLAIEERTIWRVRHEASTDLLATLPGFKHFQDQLAMEHRRATVSHQPLSLMMVALKPSRTFSEAPEASTALGDASRALIRKLRGEDSIFHLSPGVFCIVLPGVAASDAHRVANRLTEGLNDASTAGSKFSFEVSTVNYLENFASAWEMEEVVRAFLPERALWQGMSEVGAPSTTAQ